MKVLSAACIVLMLTLPAIMASEDVALSLRQREEGGEVFLDILATNLSTSPVEIVSEGMAPPWSVWAWFKWEVDGKPAEYREENVAGIPEKRETRWIATNQSIRWASIPLHALKHVVQTDIGQKADTSVIQDTKQHSVVIRPSNRWKNLVVAEGKILVGKNTTEQTGPPNP
jgi:hypothetical protein